ncbi:MAG: prenyltransferase [Myxococcales bacterium]|nr:prenyltransferase [Myxococcales bacterium]MCB9704360.1 prenyltransferase [Myxococcales bacterium]
MSSLAAWIQAARPLSQANIAVPLLFGQAVAFARYGAFDPLIFALVAAFGVAIQLFIVFANDLADEEADRLNEGPSRFGGGSRVLQEGKLSRGELLQGAAIALASALSAALFLSVHADRSWMWVAPLIAAVLVWIYSYPPLRLAYRGYGELVQGVGVGVVLPLTAVYAQTGDLSITVIPPLAPAFMLGVAGNILTSLPDHPADQAAGKRSYAVRYGQWQARRHAIELTLFASVLGHLVIPDFSRTIDLLFAAPALVLAVLGARLLGSADAVNRDECERFVLLVGGAGHALLLAWSVALFVIGLLLGA